MAQKKKQCPFCFEDIHVRAIKCKHCKTMLDGSVPTPDISPQTPDGNGAPSGGPPESIDQRLSKLRRHADQAHSDKERIEILFGLASLLLDERRDPDAAHKIFREIMALDPSNIDVLKRIQLFHINREDFGGLTAALERELKIISSPREKDELRLRLAFLYSEKLGKFEQAVDHLGAVLDAFPDEASARNILDGVLQRWSFPSDRAVELKSRILSAEGHWEALASLLETQASRSLVPHDKTRWLQVLLDVQADRLHDDAAAFETLETLVRQAPEDRGCRVRLLELGARLGRTPEVAGLLEDLSGTKGVAGTDVEEEIRTLLLEILEASGDWDQILATYRDRATRTPEEERLPLLEKILVIQSEHLTDERGAVETLQEIVELAPGRGDIRRRLLDLAVHLGRIDEILEFFGKLQRGKEISGTTTETEILDQILDVLTLHGQWDKVLAIYRQRFDAARDEEDRLSWLGRIFDVHLVHRKNPEAAFATLRDIVGLAPADPDRQQQLLELARAQGRLEEIVPFFRDLAHRKGISGTGDEARIRDYLEAVLVELEDWPQVLEEYQRHVETSKVLPDRITWLKKIVWLKAGHIKDAAGAFETLQEIAILVPANRKHLEQIMDLGGRLGRMDEVAGLMESLLSKDEVAGTGTEEDLREFFLEALKRAKAWNRLSGEYQRRVAASMTPEQRVYWLDELSDLQSRHLSDEDGALQSLRSMAALMPADREKRVRLLDQSDALGRLDESIRFLEEISQRKDVIGTSVGDEIGTQLLERKIEAGMWAQVLAAYQARLSNVKESRQRIQWMEKIREVQSSRLEDEDAAFLTLQEITALDPSDGARRRQLLANGESLGRTDDVVRFLQDLSREEGIAGTRTEQEIQDALLELYARTGRWDQVLASYRTLLAEAKKPAQRLLWLEKIHEIQVVHLKDKAAAFQTLREIVNLAPRDVERRKDLLKQGKQPERTDDVVHFLEELSKRKDIAGTTTAQEIRKALLDFLARTGRWDQVLDSYRTLLAKAKKPAQKTQWLEKILKVQTDYLKDEAAGFQTLQEIVILAPADRERRTRLITQGEEIGRPQDVIRFLEGLSLRRGIIGTRLHGEIRDEVLGLRVRCGRWNEVLASYGERLKATKAPKDRLRLLREVFEVQKTQLEDEDAAFVTIKAMLKLDPGSRDLQQELASWSRRLGRIPDILNLLAEILGRKGMVETKVGEELGQLLLDLLPDGQDISEAVLSCIEWEAARKKGKGREKAQQILRTIYPRLERWEPYLRLLEGLAKEARNSAARQSVLQEAALIAGSKIKDSARTRVLVASLFRQFPEDPAIGSWYERILLEAKDQEDLEEMYRLRIDQLAAGPEKAALRVKRALLLAPQPARRDEVVRAFLQAVEEDPGNLDIWKHLSHQLRAPVVPHELLLLALGVFNRRLPEDVAPDFAEELGRLREDLVARMVPAPSPLPAPPAPPMRPKALPNSGQASSSSETAPLRLSQPTQLYSTLSPPANEPDERLLQQKESVPPKDPLTEKDREEPEKKPEKEPSDKAEGKAENLAEKPVEGPAEEKTTKMAGAPPSPKKKRRGKKNKKKQGVAAATHAGAPVQTRVPPPASQKGGDKTAQIPASLAVGEKKEAPSKAPKPPVVKASSGRKGWLSGDFAKAGLLGLGVAVLLLCAYALGWFDSGTHEVRAVVVRGEAEEQDAGAIAGRDDVAPQPPVPTLIEVVDVVDETEISGLAQDAAPEEIPAPTLPTVDVLCDATPPIEDVPTLKEEISLVVDAAALPDTLLDQGIWDVAPEDTTDGMPDDVTVVEVPDASEEVEPETSDEGDKPVDGGRKPASPRYRKTNHPRQVLETARSAMWGCNCDGIQEVITMAENANKESRKRRGVETDNSQLRVYLRDCQKAARVWSRANDPSRKEISCEKLERELSFVRKTCKNNKEKKKGIAFILWACRETERDGAATSPESPDLGEPKSPKSPKKPAPVPKPGTPDTDSKKKDAPAPDLGAPIDKKKTKKKAPEPTPETPDLLGEDPGKPDADPFNLGGLK